MHTGPLGSTAHVLRPDGGTVAALAAVDWNRYFPRVCLDPVRGLITLMSPSHLHDGSPRTRGPRLVVIGRPAAAVRE